MLVNLITIEAYDKEDNLILMNANAHNKAGTCPNTRTETQVNICWLVNVI